MSRTRRTAGLRLLEVFGGPDTPCTRGSRISEVFADNVRAVDLAERELIWLGMAPRYSFRVYFVKLTDKGRKVLRRYIDRRNRIYRGLP